MQSSVKKLKVGLQYYLFGTGFNDLFLLHAAAAIVRRAASFFVNRFTQMRWSIPLTIPQSRSCRARRTPSSPSPKPDVRISRA